MGPKSPAELKAKVRFERRRSADDGYGNTVDDWSDPIVLAVRSAKLEPTRPSGSAGEVVIAARQQGVALWDCWVRFDSATRGVTTDDRAVDARDETRTFNIKFAEDMDGRRTWLLLQLESGTADG